MRIRLKVIRMLCLLSLSKKAYRFVKMYKNDLVNWSALRPRRPSLFRSAGKGSKRGRFARHFGSGKLKPRTNPFGEPSQTRRFTSSQTHGKVRFCPMGKNSLTSHAVGEAICCLGLPSAVTLTKAGCENCVVVKLTGCAATPCVPKMVPYKLLALTTSCGSRILLKAKAALRQTGGVAREGISSRSGETKRLLV